MSDRRTSDPQASGSRGTSLWGRLALVVFSVPVFVALTEGLLWTVDLGRSAQVADLSRGFDPGAALLVPDRSERGAWRTNLFDDPESEVRIPARDERRRVLLFGGSNTQVFPEQLLQATLAGAHPMAEPAGAPDSDAGWEVLNLGRQGYGSRRVRALVEQAMVLEPDVVVIYAGHNEFVELEFLRELTEVWGAPWEREVARLVSGLRSFGVLVDAWRPARAPEPLVRPDHQSRQLQWRETLERYVAYRDNLRAMCEAARAAGAQVIVCTLVSNLVSPPLVFTPSPEHDAATLAAFEDLRNQAVARLPKPCRVSLRPPLRLRMHDWFDGPSEPADRDAWSAPALRSMLGKLADAPASDEDNGASIEGAHWPDPDGWDDDVRALITSMEACVRPGLDPIGVRRLAEADALLRQALELVPDSPRAWFDLGLVAWLTDDEATARDAFRRAAELDRSPSSANAKVNGIVREVAATVPDVTLLDAEALFAARCPGGIVGYEVMMDSCHLQPGARVVLMEDLAQAILQLPPTPNR